MVSMVRKFSLLAVATNSPRMMLLVYTVHYALLVSELSLVAMATELKHLHGQAVNSADWIMRS